MRPNGNKVEGKGVISLRVGNFFLILFNEECGAMVLRGCMRPNGKQVENRVAGRIGCYFFQVGCSLVFGL